tara:strand:- start:6 stop:506 length:501 start_codon:yes stop_codon:yes gene_type:complete
MAWTFFDSNGSLLQGLSADSVTSAKIADDAVNSEHYVDGSIDLAHMSVNSIDSDQYVDGSIDLVHMSVNSIDSDQYVDASIDTIHLGNLQVTGAKIAANTITGDKIALGSDAAGDIMYYNGTDYIRLAKPGTPAGEALTFATSATAPSWVAASAGVGLGMVIALGG